jgi:hypothetical protein
MDGAATLYKDDAKSGQRWSALDCPDFRMR